MRLNPSIALLRTQSDERLVALARDGSEPAFTALVERYRKPVLRACRRVLSDTGAEDAAQQVFISAWRSLTRGDEVRDVRPWLMRIARNTALNALRTPGYEFDELRDSLTVSEAPQAELERREVVRRTLAGLAALPDNQREALLRSAVQGVSHAAIARDLGLTEGATRQLVMRARTTLRSTASALTPMPVVTWLAQAGAREGEAVHRIAEVAAGGSAAGATALLAKAGAVVVVAGGAAGGAAVVNRAEADKPPAPAKVQRAERSAPATPEPTATRTAAPVTAAATPAATSAPQSEADDGDDDDSGRGRGRGRGRGGDDDHSAAPMTEAVDDSSGPGSGGGEDAEDNSGPGNAEDEPEVQTPEVEVDNSGPGSTNSGSGSSGSGSSGSSGSGNSGSGGGDEPVIEEDNSGSGSSGSGSSGSGSSGSGGGDD